MKTPMEILITAFNKDRSNPERFAHYFFLVADQLLEIEKYLIEKKDLQE